MKMAGQSKLSAPINADAVKSLLAQATTLAKNAMKLQKSLDKIKTTWYNKARGEMMMNTYVRVDQTDRYIYFLNDTPLPSGTTWRSKYLLRSEGRLPCIRMKQLSKLPIDKKVNVWYNKGTK